MASFEATARAAADRHRRRRRAAGAWTPARARGSCGARRRPTRTAAASASARGRGCGAGSRATATSSRRCAGGRPSTGARRGGARWPTRASPTTRSPRSWASGSGPSAAPGTRCSPTSRRRWRRRACRSRSSPTARRACSARSSPAPGWRTASTRVVVSGDLGVGKPDASVFRHALSLLGAPAGAAVMVGDNLDRDIEGARAAGLARCGSTAPAQPMPGRRDGDLHARRASCRTLTRDRRPARLPRGPRLLRGPGRRAAGVGAGRRRRRRGGLPALGRAADRGRARGSCSRASTASTTGARCAGTSPRCARAGSRSRARTGRSRRTTSTRLREQLDRSPDLVERERDERQRPARDGGGDVRRAARRGAAGARRRPVERQRPWLDAAPPGGLLGAAAARADAARRRRAGRRVRPRGRRHAAGDRAVLGPPRRGRAAGRARRSCPRTCAWPPGSAGSS